MRESFDITSPLEKSKKLWRCSRCGKWSTAKRKPSRHMSFLPGIDEAGARAQGFEIAEGEYYESDLGSNELSGTSVWCGPFVTYRAELSPLAAKL